MGELDRNKVHVLIANPMEFQHVSQDGCVLLGAPHPSSFRCDPFIVLSPSFRVHITLFSKSWCGYPQWISLGVDPLSKHL